MHVFVTGATGFIGRALVAALHARGDRITILTRDPARAQDLVDTYGATALAGELESPTRWPPALAGVDAIVNLAGEPLVGGRWDARKKQLIRDSRVEGTRCLVEVLAALGDAAPRVLISQSGIDYYPFAHPPLDDDEVTERDPPGDGFLARVCRDWEREARAAPGRVVCLRTGVVLGPNGGVLARLAPLFDRFAGGSVGNGKQWLSWIHLDDHVAVILAALADARFTGPINAVAGSVRYRAFARALGRARHRPSLLRVPGFALRAATGELADYLLHGRNAVPAALTALGFAFRHPDLDDALAHA